jgi:hypothetical protein
VARCVEYLIEHPSVGWATSDAWLIEDGRTDRRYYGDWSSAAFASEGQLDAIAVENFVFVGAVVRRQLFEWYGEFDEQLRRSEDYDLWIRFLLGGERVGLIPEPLAGYRVRSDSLSADTERQRAAHLAVLAKHLPALWGRGARGRPGDAYDIARELERAGQRRRAASFYLLGARDRRLPPLARGKQAAAALRALLRVS